MAAVTERQLYTASIASHQELFMEGDTSQQLLQNIIDELQLSSLPKQRIPLRTDQTWAIYHEGRVHIHQLMGYISPGVWQTVQRLASSATPQIGNTLVLAKGTVTLVGAGGVETINN